jgi:hypothetical protein
MMSEVTPHVAHDNHPWIAVHDSDDGVAVQPSRGFG